MLNINPAQYAHTTAVTGGEQCPEITPAEEERLDRERLRAERTAATRAREYDLAVRGGGFLPGQGWM